MKYQKKKERAKDYYYNVFKKRPEKKKRQQEMVKKWRIANPEKRKAHTIIHNAVTLGKIVKAPCYVCGEINVQAHHEDYSKPFMVVWLCRPHHFEWDKKRRSKLRKNELKAII